MRWSTPCTCQHRREAAAPRERGTARHGTRPSQLAITAATANQPRSSTSTPSGTAGVTAHRIPLQRAREPRRDTLATRMVVRLALSLAAWRHKSSRVADEAHGPNGATWRLHQGRSEPRRVRPHGARVWHGLFRVCRWQRRVGWLRWSEWNDVQSGIRRSDVLISRCDNWAHRLQISHVDHAV